MTGWLNNPLPKSQISTSTDSTRLTDGTILVLVESDSLWPHGLQPARLLRPWDSPGKDAGVGCHFLVQGIFPGDQTWVSCIARRFFTIPATWYYRFFFKKGSVEVISLLLSMQLIMRTHPLGKSWKSSFWGKLGRKSVKFLILAKCWKGKFEMPQHFLVNVHLFFHPLLPFGNVCWNVMILNIRDPSSKHSFSPGFTQQPRPPEESWIHG